ncbi:type I 3-dehydroquinate dehydratase [Pseudogracilibacillus auburnensis]|uniref:type I 3-dehydroquinate dehydratase n=1 Tax=Pseudogracilibacillus auburnensis TaxID=1494959 RepID=UPI001A97AE61|nr:type I 3-dehydroquinate dehydratase [Pseudogracilibacillus auburnensis]MBO1005655.1 type I 3-dehydroquinate dehydratase [Pseudogracilibacillus auburnensis]
MTTDIFENKKAPYICTPLTGKTKVEVLDQLEKILPQTPDLIEWRADFLTDLADVELVLALVAEIKNTTDIPLLFTIRAAHEGGEEISLTEDEKVHLISEVCRKTKVDFVDYETSNEEKFVKAIRSVSKENGKQLILSYHNFTFTPDNEEIVKRAKLAEQHGADIAKFAVMPKTQEDVLRLLEVTKTIDDLLDVPVVTMSMGDIGGLSRIVGWAYGSIITFGVGVELSAPGQIPVKKLRETIKLTQELVPSWK